MADAERKVDMMESALYEPRLEADESSQLLARSVNIIFIQQLRQVMLRQEEDTLQASAK